jgi:drug/metabolite transporter (DMT)-like permease
MLLTYGIIGIIVGVAIFFYGLLNIRVDRPHLGRYYALITAIGLTFAILGSMMTLPKIVLEAILEKLISS